MLFRSSPRKGQAARKSQAPAIQDISKDLSSKKQTPESLWADVKARFANRKASKEDVAHRFNLYLADSRMTEELIKGLRDHLTELKKQPGARRDAFRDNILSVCEQKYIVEASCLVLQDGSYLAQQKIGRAHV